jgi:hypothetical protein
MPGNNVEPSSLTQECFTAVGSKKIAADVSDASISCEAMEKNIMVMIWLETLRRIRRVNLYARIIDYDRSETGVGRIPMCGCMTS